MDSSLVSSMYALQTLAHKQHALFLTQITSHAPLDVALGEEVAPLEKGLLEQLNNSERMEIASCCSFCDEVMKTK